MIIDLQTTIDSRLAEHNANPTPFVWTKSAAALLAKRDRAYHRFEPKHWQYDGALSRPEPCNSWSATSFCGSDIEL